MRILMLTDLYPPFIGGSEQHVRNLSQGLSRRGHQVSVATMWHPPLPVYELENEVRVHRLKGSAHRIAAFATPSGRPYAPTFPDPEVVGALRTVTARERPDIVHAHNWLVRSFIPLKTWSGARLIVTLHDYGVACAKRSLMYRGLPCTGPGFTKCLRCTARHFGTAKGMALTLGNWAMQRPQRSAVDMFLPVSHAVATGNELAADGVSYEVLPNFVPDDVASLGDVDHPSLASLPKEPFILYVGALQRDKGVHVVLSAYEGLHDPPPLVLIGTKWPDTPQRFPPNTVVLDSLPHAAVMGAWRRSLLGLVPSICPDACPTVALEAMAAGVPLVASRIGGIPDLVAHGETGLLVNPGDVEGLRSALSNLLTDQTRAERMGAEAKRRVASFTASAVLDRLEGIYSRLLAPAA
jgi:glycosyltransferase involved in cell wall biosynthesis